MNTLRLVEIRSLYRDPYPKPGLVQNMPKDFNLRAVYTVDGSYSIQENIYPGLNELFLLLGQKEDLRAFSLGGEFYVPVTGPAPLTDRTTKWVLDVDNTLVGLKKLSTLIEDACADGHRPGKVNLTADALFRRVTCCYPFFNGNKIYHIGTKFFEESYQTFGWEIEKDAFLDAYYTLIKEKEINSSFNEKATDLYLFLQEILMILGTESPEKVADLINDLVWQTLNNVTLIPRGYHIPEPKEANLGFSNVTPPVVARGDEPRNAP